MLVKLLGRVIFKEVNKYNGDVVFKARCGWCGGKDWWWRGSDYSGDVAFNFHPKLLSKTPLFEMTLIKPGNGEWLCCRCHPDPSTLETEVINGVRRCVKKKEVVLA